MTTKEAAAQYEAEHVAHYHGRPVAIFNPNNLDINKLPVIYGFNNGGSPGYMHGQLIAQDGECLGSHLCSSEAYMYADLGILDGTRPDRHETFAEHYPNGYRMMFITHDDVEHCSGLLEAFRLNQLSSPQSSNQDVPNNEQNKP